MIRGDSAGALENFQTSIRLNPAYAPAHDDLGAVLLSAKRPEEAQAQFEEAIRLQPDDADARNNLAIVLFGFGKREEALKEFGIAASLRPERADFQENLASASRPKPTLPARRLRWRRWCAAPRLNPASAMIGPSPSCGPGISPPASPSSRKRRASTPGTEGS